MVKLRPGEFRANGDGLAHGRNADGSAYIRGKPKNDGFLKKLFKNTASKPKRKAKRKTRWI